MTIQGVRLPPFLFATHDDRSGSKHVACYIKASLVFAIPDSCVDSVYVTQRDVFSNIIKCLHPGFVGSSRGTSLDKTNITVKLLNVFSQHEQQCQGN